MIGVQNLFLTICRGKLVGRNVRQDQIELNNTDTKINCIHHKDGQYHKRNPVTTAYLVTIDRDVDWRSGLYDEGVVFKVIAYVLKK